MRLFLAINLDAPVRRGVIEAISALRDAAPKVGWLDESRLHLTLKFLGEQPEDVVPRLRSATDAVVLRHRAFPMRIREVGAFPNFRRARVVWMGIEQEPRLELLHHDVEVACEALGFELDGRPFRPHLTLARIKGRADENEMRQLARAGRKVDFEEEAHVHSIDLMRSHTGGAGSRYELLHASPLRAV